MSKQSLLSTAETLLGMGGEFTEIAKYVKEQLENNGETVKKEIVDLNNLQFNLTIKGLNETIEELSQQLQEAKSENVVLKSQIPVSPETQPKTE